MRISRFELARKPVPCFLPGECLRDAFPVPVELIPAPVAVVVAMPLSLTRSPRLVKLGTRFTEVQLGLRSLPCMPKKRKEGFQDTRTEHDSVARRFLNFVLATSPHPGQRCSSLEA